MTIIKNCFEGFGIPPSEAIYCKKPAIVYDIPVLRESYGDSLDYVKPNDDAALAKQIEYYLLNPDKRKERGEEAYNGFFRKNPTPCLPVHMKQSLRRIFYGGKDLSITAGMIVLNGADTIELALKSIYDYVDKIIIVEGIVEDYAKSNPAMHENGHSIDGTIKIIQNFYDPLHKIELVFPTDISKLVWKNKNEMQNEIAKRVTTDLYLKVDADEIFLESDVEYMKRYFMEDKELYVIQLLKWEFWKNFSMIACGGIWDRPQARMWRWKKDFHHNIDVKTGFNFYIDAEGREVRPPNYKTLNLMEHLCYHLGYCRTAEHIAAKINYYKNRGIESNVNDNYTNWVPGQPTNSTHPDGTTAKPFIGKLPKILKKDYFNIVSIEVKEKFENNINMMVSPPKQKIESGSK